MLHTTCPHCRDRKLFTETRRRFRINGMRERVNRYWRKMQCVTCLKNWWVRTERRGVFIFHGPHSV